MSTPRSVRPPSSGFSCRPVLRDFIVAIVSLSIYHVLVVEILHSSDMTTVTPMNLPLQSHSIHSGSGGNGVDHDLALALATQVARQKEEQSPVETTSITSTETIITKARRISHPKGPPPILQKNHSIMKRAGSWAPIVLEKHRLLFFDVPKVGSTGFKQLFLRMIGCDLWKERNADQLHWKAASHLRTLNNYTVAEAQEMLTSPDWTRALFVRDPKERLLSAFLDKVVRNRGVYAGRACCKRYHYVREPREKKWGASKREIQCMYQVFTFEGFLHLASTECKDEPHWRAQSQRVDQEFWPYINFVGYMDSIAEDTKSMLEVLGADVWDEFGATGWGETGKESIFQGLDNAHHHTQGGAGSHYLSYFTPAIEKEADVWLADEYNHPIIQLPRRSRFASIENW